MISINPIKDVLVKAVVPLQLGFWEIAAPIVGGLIGASGAKSAAKTTAAAQESAAQLAYQQSLPWATRGMFGEATFDEPTRTVDITGAPQFQEMAERYLERSAIPGAEAAALMGSPWEAQQKIYEQQKALFAPKQEEQRQALESRLLAQGMLGSTGGQKRLAALEEGFAMEDLARQAQALTQAQQMIDLYRGRETEDIGLGIKMGELPLQYAAIGRGVGTGLSGVASTGAQMRGQAAAGLGGAQAAFWGQLGQGVASGMKKIGGLYNTASTYNTDPWSQQTRMLHEQDRW